MKGRNADLSFSLGIVIETRKYSSRIVFLVASFRD